jgi:hypothetical protein
MAGVPDQFRRAFPALGPTLNRAAGATTTMQKIIEQRETKADAAARRPTPA